MRHEYYHNGELTHVENGHVPAAVTPKPVATIEPVGEHVTDYKPVIKAFAWFLVVQVVAATAAVLLNRPIDALVTYFGVINGLAVPVFMLFGTTVKKEAEHTKRLDRIEHNTNGRMSELISKLPDEHE